MLKAGEPVPDFAYASETFGAVSARALRGKRYVLYFYPKDDTPGCTREACAFRDNLPKFAGAGVQVFGVSADDEKSHIRFSRKHLLPFKLIPDPDHVICERFGTWIEKSMYGRSYMGVARTTFVIAADGRIERIWEKVAPDGHAEEVLAWLNGETQPGTASSGGKSRPAAAARSPATTASDKSASASKPKAQPSPTAPIVKTAPADARQTPKPATSGPAKADVGAGKPTAKKIALAPSKAGRAAAVKTAAKPTKPAKPIKAAPKKAPAKPSKASKAAPAKATSKATKRPASAHRPVAAKKTRR